MEKIYGAKELTETYGIWELTGEAYDNAISETVRVLNTVTKKQHDREEAYWVARCFGARFDVNGHLENYRIM